MLSGLAFLDRSRPACRDLSRAGERLVSNFERFVQADCAPNNRRRALLCLQSEIKGNLSMTVSPEGRRTAQETFCLHRIITPSIIAWPPTLVFLTSLARNNGKRTIEVKYGCFFMSGFAMNRKRAEKERPLSARLRTVQSYDSFFRCGVSLLEALDSSRAINELLLAGIERMAFIANVDMRALDGRLGFNDIAA